MKIFLWYVQKVYSFFGRCQFGDVFSVNWRVIWHDSTTIRVQIIRKRKSKTKAIQWFLKMRFETSSFRFTPNIGGQRCWKMFEIQEIFNLTSDYLVFQWNLEPFIRFRKINRFQLFLPKVNTICVIFVQLVRFKMLNRKLNSCIILNTNRRVKEKSPPNKRNRRIWIFLLVEKHFGKDKERKTHTCMCECNYV